MKKIKFYLLLLITMIVFLPSCSDDKEDKTELPPWNKANTISVYFLSKMDGNSLFSSTSEYSTVKNYLGGKSYKMALLDCCNLIDYANDKNPTVSLAYDLDKVPSFALNTFNDNKPAGTGILLDQLLSVQKELKLDDECYLKTIDIQVLSSSKDTKFATVKLSKDSHIDKFSSEVANLLKERTFLIGSIKRELYNKLENNLKYNSAGYRLEKSTSSDGNFDVFTLVTKDWISRDISTEKTGNIQSFRVQLEFIN